MKIAILGYGKMGKAIERIALERGHTICLKLNSANLDELTTENLSKADVAIEFSTPDNVLANINLSLKAGTPIAIGTTGWYNKQDEVYKKVEAVNGCLLAASNFSVGVNIFFELNRKLAQLMKNQPNYTAEIQEIHHTEKLDSPSGTAITLAEDLIQSSSIYTHWQNSANENKDSLEIKSFREPEVPGTHEINYDSDIDSIRIIHEAKNRNGFALGAVLAAEYIHNKKGIFTMQDVLKN